MTTHPAETVYATPRKEPRDDGWWMPGPDSFAACALSASARTVADARRFTLSTLRGWQICAALADDATLIVSELVSNALRYGVRDAHGTAGGRVAGPVVTPAWLALTRRDDGVMCAVSDGGESTPVIGAPDPLAESGRGLRIVEQLSDAWGWTLPDRSGKTVWATLSPRN
ncbi:ATP-binding protein [Streptomyces benahoarensis]|uniref:ATP-binding protein n=1 Tax=Streptomyces benahoarensis TaxID=2595054 RepID=A0A553Z194_9ACTN|nr:ATP-binding protein [Streptomyces benahoarensis]TSB18024.1 ATP-binding protein [Streptomyces benahoarensis]TSB35247.1 ATP-binding protein [Streptomyces benahoarensis]